MKKLYRKGTVHPSPPPPPMVSDQYLSFLPAAILAMAADLSAEDREVLAYLLVSSSNRPKRPSSGGGAARGSHGDHAPQFGCDCFRCYTSYWVRWGSSPNRQLIHEIIEAFEEHDHHRHVAVPVHKGGGGSGARGGRRDRRNNNNKQRSGRGGRASGGEDGVVSAPLSGELKRAEPAESTEPAESEAVRGGEGEGEGEDGASAEKGSSSQVRRLVSFIGERIWGVWG